MKIYLNAFNRNKNNYFSGGDEKYYMNLIIDEISNLLDSSGIEYSRNSTENVKFENNKFIYISLHSGDNLDNVKIFYKNEKRLAEVIKEKFVTFFSEKTQINLSSRNFPDKIISKMPAISINFGNHEKESISKWIRENMENISKAIVISIAEYLSVPFLLPKKKKVLKIYKETCILERPNINSKILVKAKISENIEIINQWENWYLVKYKDIIGYMNII
ncbi:MAG: N-acetylmuramoyl-L-alanine amidase [Candidatus Paraimprobicoccus trichonymphae]|uniref:N-acetylmuramoyl-L-alanine amidase n=1 Tax=Candidatus Paraimprobicoccus trichonymphae TaxID=3033793 RepID=A0AA48I9Y2_9FIRM|nr:MAG: N-acetylmuramoyl-L-alanine amidase [Candidatus Paraimprobicoccus trichonymphae]